jgi:hypothetical protein
MVRVPSYLCVEEFDRGVLGPQELRGVVEVLPGLRDRALGVVVELLVLVPGDDVPGLAGLDLVDRVPPWPEATDGHAGARGTCARRCRSGRRRR